MKIFGAALDPLSSPERLNLKLGYLNWVFNNPLANSSYLDPYDLIKSDLEEEVDLFGAGDWVGKFPVDSWLTPKPTLDDARSITCQRFNAFLKENGCLRYWKLVENYMDQRILPSKPVMIGVDHSLTGAVIRTLAKHIDSLNVIVLDAHFDVARYQSLSLPFELRSSDEGRWHSNPLGSKEEITFLECGNFISFILEEGVVRPDNLWVIGVQDEILMYPKVESYSNPEWAQFNEYRKWMDRGIHLVTKKELISHSFTIDLKGPVYLSIDMDVGSLSSVFSARFMNCVGLTYDDFMKSLHLLSGMIRQSKNPLLGLDIMELDIHLLEACELSPYEDHSRRLTREIFRVFSEDLEGDMPF